MAVIKGGFEIVKRAMLKELMKRGDDGIMLTLPKNELVDLNARITMDRLIKAGIDPESLTSPDQVLNVLENINNQMMKNTRVLSGDEAAKFLNKAFPKKGEVVNFPQKRSFAEEIEAMKKSGDIVDKDNMVINEKITDREMFKDASKRFNKKETEAEIAARINKENKKGIANIKNQKMVDDAIDNASPGFAGDRKYDAQLVADDLAEKRFGKEFYDLDEIDQMELYDEAYQGLTKKKFDPPEDMAKGGRAGFDGGGISGLRSDPEVAKKINKILEDKLIKQQPEGVLMDPPPRPNYELIEEMLNPKDKGLLPNNTIEFDDGTIFFKDSGEYYKQDGTEVEGPSKGAKVKPITMEAATGGRAGHYTGGMVDVEPNLSDIGHGSDALMARTRLVAPNSQATTSTGLNYLLAEDNDNIRVPFGSGKKVYDYNSFDHKINELKAHYKRFKKMGGTIPFEIFSKAFAEQNFAEGGRTGFQGGGMGRRAFLKLMATLGGGIAGIKSGLIGMSGKETGKQAAKEIVKSAGSGTPPPYFFKLVEKIKVLGDDITEKAATTDRQKVTKYKDYELTEDVATGEQTVQKIKLEGPEYYDEQLAEELYMNYKPGKGLADEGTKGIPADEYIEDTGYLRTSGPDKGELFDSADGLTDDSFKEIIEEIGEVVTKKAEGGRIGFSAGNLAKLGINSTSRRFLEKIFGKEGFQTMIENDPRMHKGMLEVVEMFRNRDKEGLKMYLQKFLPDMSDAEIEDFIIGSGDSSGISGQLIRLGSGREYRNLIDLKKQADNVRKLEDFDIDGVSKNAEGGRIGFSGGGIFRAIIAKAAAAKGLKPYEFIKVTSYKSLPPEVKMFLSADDFAKLKSGQQDMYTNYIDMAKTRKNFQEQVEGGKTTPAKELFEGMERTMDDQSYVPKNVTNKDIAEMELMVKNRFNKGRKDNAQGGLQTMLGE